MTEIHALDPEPLTPQEQRMAQLISEGEPFFTLRASDFFAVPILAAYIKMVEDYGPQDHRLQQELYDEINRLREWQTVYPERVRFPNVVLPRPDTD